jgi:hypothetical protein
MKRNTRQIVLTGVLTAVVGALMSCSFTIPVSITGRIRHFEALNRATLRITFENIYVYHNSNEPDSLVLHEDGSFYLSSKFQSVLPQSLTLWQANEVVARLVIKQQADSVLFLDPITTTYQRFAYNHTRPTKIANLQINPVSDSASLQILNIDKLLDRLQYSDQELIFHFTSPPPAGSTLYLWGGSRGDKFKDTTFEICDTKVRFDNRFFWDADRQKIIFEGGRYSNPYGWFKPFAAGDLVGHPTR